MDYTFIKATEIFDRLMKTSRAQHMPPRSCDNMTNDLGKIIMEAMMGKLLKGVDSTNAGVKEMRSDL